MVQILEGDNAVYSSSGWSMLVYDTDHCKAYFSPNNDADHRYHGGRFVQCHGLIVNDGYLHFVGRNDLPPVLTHVSHNKHWKGDCREVVIPDHYFDYPV